MQQTGFFIAKLIVCSTCFGHHYAHQQDPATRTHNSQLHTRPTTCKPKRQVPQAATICITLELLMMGIMVPLTCWANNKFCNKKISLLHLVGLLFSTYLFQPFFCIFLNIFCMSLSLCDLDNVYMKVFILNYTWILNYMIQQHGGVIFRQ